MAKILKCPECGAQSADLYLEERVSAIYDVESDPTDPDGVRPMNKRYEHGGGEWTIACKKCGTYRDDAGFTRDFLVEVGDDE